MTRMFRDEIAWRRAGCLPLLVLGMVACHGGQASPVAAGSGGHGGGPFPGQGGGGSQPPRGDAGVPAEVDGGDGGPACPPLPTAGPIPSGTAGQQPAGAAVPSSATRPQLSSSVADGQYTMLQALAHGGLVLGPDVPATDGGSPSGGPSGVTYSLNDSWDPIRNGIGDPATFNPVFTVAADGSGTHTTIGAALAAAVLLTPCDRAYVRILPGVYREQVLLPSKTSAPPVTLYSTETDASRTVIVFNGSIATKGNVSATATMTVKAVSGFQMKNLTVANDAVEDPASPIDPSGVAFLNQCDRAQFENVRFLGNVATLYVKSLDANTVARSYFRDCYIEGDEDVILGRGTAVFDHCEIKYLAARQPSGGILASPSTVLNSRFGFLFDSCQLTAEAGASGVFLGHQWFESSNVAAIGKMIVRNSTLGGHLAAAAPWSTLGNRTTTPRSPSGTAPLLVYTSDDFYPSVTAPVPAQPFLAEYGNTGPGSRP